MALIRMCDRQHNVPTPAYATITVRYDNNLTAPYDSDLCREHFMNDLTGYSTGAMETGVTYVLRLAE